MQPQYPTAFADELRPATQEPGPSSDTSLLPSPPLPGLTRITCKYHTDYQDMEWASTSICEHSRNSSSDLVLSFHSTRGLQWIWTSGLRALLLERGVWRSLVGWGYFGARIRVMQSAHSNRLEERNLQSQWTLMPHTLCTALQNVSSMFHDDQRHIAAE